VDNPFTQFFADHVIGTILVIVAVLFLFTRGGGGFLGSWIVRILLFTMIAVWIWIALMSYLDSLARKAERYAGEAQSEVANHTPQWMKDLWQKLKPMLPSPGEKLMDYVCDKTEIAVLCGAAKGAIEGFEEVSRELDKAEKMCPTIPAVKMKEENEAFAACSPTGATFSATKKRLDALMAGAEKGAAQAASPVPLFIPEQPNKLNAPEYQTCLQNAVGDKAANAATGCYDQKNYPTYVDWRLCMEITLQVTKPPPSGSTMSPVLYNCRVSAGLP